MCVGAGQVTLKRLIYAVCVALTGAALPADADPKLQLVTNFLWSENQPWFGGFSGAEISADGTVITLLSDRGTLVTADLIRDQGQISDVRLRSHLPLSDIRNLTGTDVSFDAEGLAIDDQAHAFISLEQDHRVAELDLFTAAIRPLPRHGNFAGFPQNAGLEALAIGPEGALYGIPESSDDHDAAFAIYRFKNNGWQIINHLSRQGPFVPVGADFGPDGLLYLLERAVTPLGFRSRIRRIDLAAPRLVPQTLLSTGPARFDNLEALTLWRDPTGKTRLVMVSDDNFLSIQHSQIVEYILTE
ncbi:MAG: hypothetical protein ACJAVM_001076 [Sulfitobacter sp.]|jgi:hypothetical protein